MDSERATNNETGDNIFGGTQTEKAVESKQAVPAKSSNVTQQNKLPKLSRLQNLLEQSYNENENRISVYFI